MENGEFNGDYINEGYIILARRLLESRSWKICNAEQRSMMIYTLLRANYKDNTWWDGSKAISIPRGSFVAGRNNFAEETKTSEQRVRTFWDKMKNIGFLTIKPTSKNSIITICNYERYQNKKNYKQPTHQPDSNQRATTNNKSNKGKYIYTPQFTSFWEVYPKKKEKEVAFTCWQTAIKSNPPEHVIEAAKNYAEECRVKNTERDYIKNPATFLNKGRYRDYLPCNYKKQNGRFRLV